MNDATLIVNANLLLAGETGGEHIQKGWLSLREGLIHGIGSGQPPIEDATVIDAAGRTVLPGFIDNHFHTIITAFHRVRVDFSNARNFQEIGAILQDARPEAGRNVIIGVGLDYMELEEKRLPDRTVLDQYCSKMPLVIYSRDYHTLMLNTYAVLYFKTPLSLNGVELDTMGVPTGIFGKQAGAKLDRIIIQSATDDERLRAVENLTPSLLGRGITTMAAMEGENIKNSFDEDADSEFLLKYKDTSPLTMDIFYQTLDIDRVLRKGLRRIGGALYLDGTLGSRTAALRFDYADTPGKWGMLFFTQDDLNYFVRQCSELGLQVALDAIGDAAIEMALCAFEHAAQTVDVRPLRHRIEHAELIDRQQMARAAALGVILSMQPTYEGYWGEVGGTYQSRLGSHYGTTNNFRAILDAGVMVCGGSDSDVTDFDPLLGIHWAVNHPIAANRATLMEALRMYTYNGAFALGREGELGSLAVGKKADIVMLDSDITTVPTDRLRNVQVDMTIKEGTILFRRQYA